MDILSKIIKTFFGTKSDKDRKEIQPYVDRILALYPQIDALSNDELRARSAALRHDIAETIRPDEEKIAELKAILEQPDTSIEDKERHSREIDRLTKEIDDKIETKLDEILPEAFAIMKSTARRFAQNETIEVTATQFDRDLAATKDFVTIDGRGGATGSSPQLLRDSASVPTIYALHRARKYLDSIGSDISLIITGGLRVSSDFAKAIAMGADAVAIASAALIAAACQQYRICGTGKCPVGIATQDEELRKRLKIDAAAQRVANFLICSNNELKTYARITGHKNVHDLNTGDLCTINKEISDYTNIPHA